MEKKKILFLNFSLHSGGIEKSLVTLLSLFDYDRYEVDLQLFADEGLFLDRVPEQVHHLPSLFPGEYRKNIREALPILLRQGHPLIALCRLLVTFAGKTRGEMGDRLYRMWRIERHFVRAPKKEYDAVVAFMEGQPIYYAVSKVRAKRKIGFIHGDYGAMGLNADLDRRYVARLDALCTVSESCRAALCKAFPGGDAKFHVIYNIISARFMRQMAEASADFGDGFTGPPVAPEGTGSGSSRRYADEEARLCVSLVYHRRRSGGSRFEAAGKGAGAVRDGRFPWRTRESVPLPAGLRYLCADVSV